jgi:WD40 repeat protein
VVHLWSVEDSEPSGPRLAAGENFGSIRFSPDGSRLLVAGDRLRIFEVASRRLLGGPVDSGGIIEAAFSPDGRTIRTIGDDQTVRLWDGASAEPLCPPIEHGGEIRQAVFSRDSRLIATAAAGAGGRIYDAVSGELVWLAPAQAAVVADVAFTPDGKLLATAAGSVVRLWSIASDQRPIKRILAHAEMLSRQRFDAGGGMEYLPPETLTALWHQLRESPSVPVQ